MVDAGDELDDGGSEGIVGGEGEDDAEFTGVVGGFGGRGESDVPCVEGFGGGKGDGEAFGGVLTDFSVFLRGFRVTAKEGWMREGRRTLAMRLVDMVMVLMEE